MPNSGTVRALAVCVVIAWAAIEAVQPEPAKNDYSDKRNWLCWPGRAADACAADETTTVVAADGTLSREEFARNADAPVDCFYVYPTISTERTGNADMTLGYEEKAVVAQQFARFGSVCRTYAPLYRQTTLSALIAAMRGAPIPADQERAYSDVRDAWNYYLAHENRGRGVILVGHSQGTAILIQMIRSEIDGKPVQHRLISAILLGSRLAVPAGGVMGGDFKSIPLCRAPAQTQCAIVYASYRADAPPPAGSHLAAAPAANSVAACTNPAALAGGPGELQSYLPTHNSFRGFSAAPGSWVKGKEIDTPFVSVPGLLSAECVITNQGSYLAVTVHGDPNGPRTRNIGGEVVFDGKVQADWGLHLIDASLAMGNLIDIARAQSKTYLAQR